MLYRIVQCWIRLALIIFCRKIHFSNRKILNQRGPLLLALNHPNSFFDAILIGSHFKQPVHFLARGDAFRNPLVKKILNALKLIPIYRLTEGREYLALNDATFDQCREILLKGGIVLIFAEGLCRNQWQLRSLKKGAARIALDAWAQPSIREKFMVQPVSLNYNSFDHFGKRVVVQFPEPLQKSDLAMQLSEGERVKQFNQILSRKLSEGMLEATEQSNVIPFLISNHSSYQGPADQLIVRLKSKQEYLSKQSSAMRGFSGSNLLANNDRQLVACLILALLLAPFALIGWLINAPLYFPIRNFVKKKTSGTVFYDSVLFGMLLLTYPIYSLLINLLGLFFAHHSYVQLVLLAMPLFGWLLLIWKDNIEKTIHFLSLSRKDKRVLDFV